jgi:hypothetical protein
MVPILLSACVGWLSGGTSEIMVVPQAEVPDLGRVDWLLSFEGGDLSVILEVDGLAYHDGQEQFANDRRRDRAALHAGNIPIRFTAKELTDDGWGVAIELHNIISQLLARRQLGINARKQLAPPVTESVPEPATVEGAVG